MCRRCMRDSSPQISSQHLALTQTGAHQPQPTVDLLLLYPLLSPQARFHLCLLPAKPPSPTLPQPQGWVNP